MASKTNEIRLRGSLRLNFEVDPDEPGYVTVDGIPLANELRRVLEAGSGITHLDVGEVYISICLVQGLVSDLPGQKFLWSDEVEDD